MRKTLDQIMWFIFFMFKPSYWFMNNHYCEKWDMRLRFLLKNYSFRYEGKYLARLGSEIIWIANHPYASMNLFQHSAYREVRPSRKTIYLAHKKYLKDIQGDYL